MSPADAPRTPAGPAVTPLRLGVWRRRVNPLLLDRIMNTGESRRIRSRVCSRLSGDVLEIGFGTGHNLPHLPSEVRRVLAVEPVPRARELAEQRIAESGAVVEHVGSDARSLPLADQSVDAVLCTWNLCSIDDAHVAVAEVGRVLRPGGELHFVEHGRADAERTRRWQHRLDPVWSRIACGCHLDRDIPSIVEAGGLEITELTTYFIDSEPKLLGWTFEGRARVR